MIDWIMKVQGSYITERTTDGDYNFEVVGPYQKQPCKWFAYYKKVRICLGEAESVDQAKFRALSSKVDHMHGLAPYPY